MSKAFRGFDKFLRKMNVIPSNIGYVFIGDSEWGIDLIKRKVIKYIALQGMF